MKQGHSYQRLPNKRDHNCFGCSPTNPSGLQMEFYADHARVVSWLTVPEHLCGWDRLVHGGVLSTILDEIMNWTALHFYKKFTLTKSMTVDFLKPAHIDKKFRAEAKPMQRNGRHEVLISGSLYDEDDQLCARATATLMMVTPKVARRLGIMDSAEIETSAALTGCQV